MRPRHRRHDDHDHLTWAAPTAAYARAIALAARLNHHLFDTLYHALALETPNAIFVTADRGYFDKSRHLGPIAWLPDFVAASGITIKKIAAYARSMRATATFNP